jgi:trans-aconitate methyltransferase
MRRSPSEQAGATIVPMSGQQQWNPRLYQAGHSFVWQYGRDLLELLDAKPGERILDVGCGTGQLTAEIAQAGAQVVGTDSSPQMVAAAQGNFPELRFEMIGATALPFSNEFDAVFSNATLHWIGDQQGAVTAIARALKSGGRFVFEMGGRNNLRQVMNAGFRALASFGLERPERLCPWFFPSIGEYAVLLESHGLSVTFAVLFERPTVLQGGESGLVNWIEMFGGFATQAVTPEQREQLIARWQTLARPALLQNGDWIADYRRLRMVGIKDKA